MKCGACEDTSSLEESCERERNYAMIVDLTKDGIVFADDSNPTTKASKRLLDNACTRSAENAVNVG